MSLGARSLTILALLACATLRAQMPIPYGLPISLAEARKPAEAALAEAAKNKWNMAVAIVDPDGTLIYFAKMDNTQHASALVAIDKARTAAIYKRPSKAMQDALAAGGVGLRILKLHDCTPVEGGFPLIVDGKIIGAIGVSGDTSSNDSICSAAGAAVVK